MRLNFWKKKKKHVLHRRWMRALGPVLLTRPVFILIYKTKQRINAMPDILEAVWFTFGYLGNVGIGVLAATAVALRGLVLWSGQRHLCLYEGCARRQREARQVHHLAGRKNTPVLPILVTDTFCLPRRLRGAPPWPSCGGGKACWSGWLLLPTRHHGLRQRQRCPRLGGDEGHIRTYLSLPPPVVVALLNMMVAFFFFLTFRITWFNDK